MSETDSAKREIDVFVSYNSADNHRVAQVVRWLEQTCGYEVFLDRDDILLGDILTEKLNDAIQRTRCALIFQSAHGLGNWQRREISAFTNLSASDKNVRMIPVALCIDVSKLDPLFYGALSLQLADEDFDDERALANKLQPVRKALDHDRPAKVTMAPTPVPESVVTPFRPPTISRPLLPKLCDRRAHCANVRSMAPRSENAPTIFVLPSEPEQSIGSFFTRLRRVDLVLSLRLSQEDVIPTPISLELPEDYASEEVFHDHVRRSLAYELQMANVDVAESASNAEIATAMKVLPEITLVRMTLTELSWGRQGAQRVDGVLQYWLDFSNLPEGRRLYVFVCLELGDSTHRDSMDAYLEQLAEHHEDEDSRVTVLPKMDGATKADLVAWATSPEVSRNFSDPDELEENVRDWIHTLSLQPNQRIPLRHAEKKLKEIIAEF